MWMKNEDAVAAGCGEGGAPILMADRARKAVTTPHRDARGVGARYVCLGTGSSRVNLGRYVGSGRASLPGACTKAVVCGSARTTPVLARPRGHKEWARVAGRWRRARRSG